MKLIILASQSKGRKELLEEAGFTFTVMPADFDEASLHMESPYRMVEQLALAKARAVAAKVTEPAIIIAGDVVGRVDGKIVGKAKDKDRTSPLIFTLIFILNLLMQPMNSLSDEPPPPEPVSLQPRAPARRAVSQA